MKNLINSFIVILALFILAVPLRSQDCISQSQVIIVDNDTTLLSLVVENALNDTIGVNGQGLCGVKIKFKHEYIGDLLVELIAPNGQTIVLMGPPTTNSSSTDLVCWDVTFVPNSFVASPDADFDDYWNNFNVWAILSQYDGSYYPFNGILEDFNGSSVNGTWTLRIDDISLLGDGIIESFELVFCDPSGIGCFNCNPNGGTIAPTTVAYCEGDDNLVIPFNPDYGNEIPDPSVYDYLHIISGNDVVLEYADVVDLTMYDPGVYEVCGISILNEVVEDLPQINGGFGLDSIEHQISLGLLCAETTLGCYTVEVYNIPDTVFIQDTICLGTSYQVGNQFFSSEEIHEVTLFNGECDSIVVLDLEVIDIQVDAIASSMSISCSDEFLTIDGSNSVLDANTSVLWTTIDGMIISDPSQLIIEVGASGTYLLTLDDNICSESIPITITSNEELPEISFAAVNSLDCETDSLQINITVPGTITDYIWQGPGGFSSMVEDPFVYTSGVYYVTLMNDFGCEGNDSIEVNYDNVLDVPSFTFDTLTCDNLMTQIITDINN